MPLYVVPTSNASTSFRPGPLNAEREVDIRKMGGEIRKGLSMPWTLALNWLLFPMPHFAGNAYSECINVTSINQTLPGPDYFDEEAKCYGRLFEFCQVTFCYSRQWGCMTLAKF